MPKAASPVRYGDGRDKAADITAQARHFTLDALDAIAGLLRGADTDGKLRFAVAKFILELGWGRARAMPPAEAPTEALTLTGALELQFMQLLESHADEADADPRLGGAAAAAAAGGRMAADRAAEPADTER